jgi:hypothetical protein
VRAVSAGSAQAADDTIGSVLGEMGMDALHVAGRLGDAAFIADVVANSYVGNSVNFVRAWGGDPTMAEAVRSGRMSADAFVPGLKGNPAWDIFSAIYDPLFPKSMGGTGSMWSDPRSAFDGWVQGTLGTFLNGVADLLGLLARPLGLVPSAEHAASRGGAWGDPHYTTSDGAHYDFQQVGEFVMVQSKTPGGIVVQVRQEPYNASTFVSSFSAVAAQVGQHRVGLYLGQDPPLHVDGVQTDPGCGINFEDGSKIVTTGDAYEVDWASGESLQVRLHETFLDVNVALAASDAGSVQGLLGNFDGDPTNDYAARDGTVYPQPIAAQTLYGLFSSQWRLSQQESLFDYANGQSTATFTDLGFPSSFYTASSLPPATYKTAQTTCTNAGVTDPTLLNACILDVGVTANVEFASSAMVAQPPPYLSEPACASGINQCSTNADCANSQSGPSCKQGSDGCFYCGS